MITVKKITQLTGSELKQFNDTELEEMKEAVKKAVKKAIKGNNLSLVKKLNLTIDLIDDCMGYETVTLELKIKNLHDAKDLFIQSEYRVPKEQPLRSNAIANAKQDMLNCYIEVVEVS